MASPFLDVITARPILLDAGIGLRLILARQIGEDESSARANLDLPEAVLALHRDDLAAGSDAIFTNTFATNRPSLKREGREADFVAANRRAVALARQAAGPMKFLIGSIGPMPEPIAGAYQEQAELLEECGVDALILETHKFEAAEVGLRAIANRVQVPILVSLFVWPNDATGAARNLLDAGASAIGANCGFGSTDVLHIIKRLAGRVGAPLLAKPSVGPDDSPEVFADLAIKFREMGIRLMGGCCGATSAHLAAMRYVLN